MLFRSGTLTPTQVVLEAKQASLVAFALTDHDTIDGIEEALKVVVQIKETTGETAPVVIPGIELSASYLDREVHIVGLDIDYKNETLNQALTGIIQERTERNLKMLERLADDHIYLSYDDLTNGNPDAVVTRAHFAKALLEKGYVKTRQEAFNKFLDSKTKYYVPRTYINAPEAIKYILSAGGIPVLAHPLLYHFDEYQLDKLFKM